MGNATSALVDKDFALIVSKIILTTRWLPELCTAKPHDARNGEDTRGALQVLFLCTIKLVVFIVDTYNTHTFYGVVHLL